MRRLSVVVLYRIYIDTIKNCSLWMPLDDIDEATTVRFVRGSHRWGSRFRPRYFATESNYVIRLLENEQEITGAQLDKHYEDVPVDKIEAGQWEIIQWPVKVFLSFFFLLSSVNFEASVYIYLGR